MHKRSSRLQFTFPSSLRLEEKDRAFFERMWQGGLDRYAARIHNIGFERQGRVLDAGCGFGQWLLVLAQKNKEVLGIDVDANRVAVAQALIRKNKLRNASVRQETVEHIAEPDASFDCIFSYSTVFYTDYLQTLRTFYRLLKPGGKLYFTTNSWGKYLHDLLWNPNATEDFSPRRFACHVLFTNLFGLQGPATVTPKRRLRRQLSEIGFKNIRMGPDGALTLKGTASKQLSFFPPTYCGLDSVYEVLAEK